MATQVWGRKRDYQKYTYLVCTELNTKICMQLFDVFYIYDTSFRELKCGGLIWLFWLTGGCIPCLLKYIVQIVVKWKFLSLI